MAAYHSAFRLQQKVHIDGDDSITASVTALLHRTTSATTAECSWIQDGHSRVAWIEEWRLAAANPEDTDQF